jgi:hypothetical protein
MKQSRLASLAETSLSTAAGFGLAVALQATILPALGVPIALEQNLGFAAVMTVASIARQYLMRRLFEALNIRVPLSPAILAVMAERRRQVEVEGFTAAHDDGYIQGTLARAAGSYCIHASGAFSGADSIPPALWPWSVDWWKPAGMRRDLVKAGALVLAELDLHEFRRKSLQWTPGEIAQIRRNEKGRPPIVYNKISKPIDSSKANRP